MELVVQSPPGQRPSSLTAAPTTSLPPSSMLRPGDARRMWLVARAGSKLCRGPANTACTSLGFPVQCAVQPASVSYYGLKYWQPAGNQWCRRHHVSLLRTSGGSIQLQGGGGSSPTHITLNPAAGLRSHASPVSNLGKAGTGACLT